MLLSTLDSNRTLFFLYLTMKPLNKNILQPSMIGALSVLIFIQLVNIKVVLLFLRTWEPGISCSLKIISYLSSCCGMFPTGDMKELNKIQMRTPKYRAAGCKYCPITWNCAEDCFRWSSLEEESMVNTIISTSQSRTSPFCALRVLMHPNETRNIEKGAELNQKWTEQVFIAAVLSLILNFLWNSRQVCCSPSSLC